MRLSIKGLKNLSTNLPDSAVILTGVGVVGSMMESMLCMRRSPRHMKIMYDITGEDFYNYRYLQMTKSNNWLRLHGYPMRRKLHK
jgi:hypothetical protein